MQVLREPSPCLIWVQNPGDALMDVHITHGHALLAAGIRALLAPHARMAPADAGRPRTAGRPGVLVTDLEQALAWRGDEASVLVVESGLTPHKVKALLGSNIPGCVSAEADCGELLLAVRTLSVGGSHFCPATRNLFAQALTHPELTVREQGVLELLCEGLDNKSIASRMGIAPGTVKSHVKSILAKSGQRTRTAVAAQALGKGWVKAAL